ncbi:hypothetical protein GFC29_1294 [Anoxybacillus sp. B7M1]|nr:hypothetical protein GFC28_330 [Anoxybacillus sp. B2M1]ANB62861.1 hypothetical protein GFC29_1294 [Anoxybacillus sp. B7M1]
MVAVSFFIWNPLYIGILYKQHDRKTNVMDF